MTGYVYNFLLVYVYKLSVSDNGIFSNVIQGKTDGSTTGLFKITDNSFPATALLPASSTTLLLRRCRPVISSIFPSTLQEFTSWPNTQNMCLEAKTDLERWLLPECHALTLVYNLYLNVQLPFSLSVLLSKGTFY